MTTAPENALRYMALMLSTLLSHAANLTGMAPKLSLHAELMCDIPMYRG